MSENKRELKSTGKLGTIGTKIKIIAILLVVVILTYVIIFEVSSIAYHFGSTPYQGCGDIDSYGFLEDYTDEKEVQFLYSEQSDYLYTGKDTDKIYYDTYNKDELEDDEDNPLPVYLCAEYGTDTRYGYFVFNELMNKCYFLTNYWEDGGVVLTATDHNLSDDQSAMESDSDKHKLYISEAFYETFNESCEDDPRIYFVRFEITDDMIDDLPDLGPYPLEIVQCGAAPTLNTFQDIVQNCSVRSGARCDDYLLPYPLRSGYYYLNGVDDSGNPAMGVIDSPHLGTHDHDDLAHMPHCVVPMWVQLCVEDGICSASLSDFNNRGNYTRCCAGSVSIVLKHLGIVSELNTGATGCRNMIANSPNFMRITTMEQLQEYASQPGAIIVGCQQSEDSYSHIFFCGCYPLTAGQPDYQYWETYDGWWEFAGGFTASQQPLGTNGSPQLSMRPSPRSLSSCEYYVYTG